MILWRAKLLRTEVVAPVAKGYLSTETWPRIHLLCSAMYS